MLEFILGALYVFSTLFVLVVGTILFGAIAIYFIDRNQTHDAIRRNFPLLGRFRTLFTKLGEFFRQYFFAMDREELPFNRAERDWIYRAAADKGNTVAFGSTRSIVTPGTAIFINAPIPILEEDDLVTPPMQIGEKCRQPYVAPSVINISGMSFGALSAPAVKALSMGAKRAGCWLNTGEGGLSPHHEAAKCDIVFQIGTAKYGVRDGEGNLDDDKLKALAAKDHVKMFEIKLSQGAKPGKGGILPGAKVTAEIASIRGIPEGKDSISPNRHPELKDVDSFLDMINHVREVTGKPVGFKAVIADDGWLRLLFEEILKRGRDCAPDFFTLDGGDGGTGAAPMPLMDHVGLPLRESLPMVANLLVEYGLKDRIRLICSGKAVTPVGVAMALAQGADFVVTARGAMLSLGCIQAMKCNRNTCPTGITTHDKKLQRGLVPIEKSYKVANYINSLYHEVDIIAHSCGVADQRNLDRCHVRIVTGPNISQKLSDLFPWPETRH